MATRRIATRGLFILAASILGACAGSEPSRLCFYGAKTSGDFRPKSLAEYVGPRELELAEAHVGGVLVPGVWTVYFSLDRRSYETVVAWIRANPDRHVVLTWGEKVLTPIEWMLHDLATFERQMLYSHLTFGRPEEAERLRTELLSARAAW